MSLNFREIMRKFNFVYWFMKKVFVKYLLYVYYSCRFFEDYFCLDVFLNLLSIKYMLDFVLVIGDLILNFLFGFL